MHYNEIVGMRKVFSNLESNTYKALKHTLNKINKPHSIERDLFVTFNFITLWSIEITLIPNT